MALCDVSEAPTSAPRSVKLETQRGRRSFDQSSQGFVSRNLVSMSIRLRPATIEDSPILKTWDFDADVGSSGGEDDNYDWDYELPRLVSWREFLIAEVDSCPIGMDVLIDALREESHYWGEDAPEDSWALDIWIGSEIHRSKGFGTQMMKKSLTRCFETHSASCVLIDPLQSNKRAIEFYRRLGFIDVGPRRFGNDDCLVMSIGNS